jgi:hypothetical protein
MKLKHIFGPRGSKDEGVWAIKYDDLPEDELTFIFELWQDTEYMYKYCDNNLELIQAAYEKPLSNAIRAHLLIEEAEELLEKLIDLATKPTFKPHLQELFKPLNNSESNLTILQLSKGSIKNRHIRNPKLRLYAIRIAGNAYVVTGGAIKLTDTMAEGVDTSKQLERLKMVRDWLKNNDISFPEDLNELL